MSHPLSALAARIGDRRAKWRDRRKIAEIQNDAHLARDVGLPHLPRETRKIELW